MADSISIGLVKARSERTRQQLWRIGGVINTAAKALDNDEADIDDRARSELYQALMLAAETLDAAAWALAGETITKAPTEQEQRELRGDESEARP